MNKDNTALYNSYMDIFNAIFKAYDKAKAKELLILLFNNTEVETARIIIKGMGLDNEFIKTVEKNNTEVKGA